MLSNDGFDAQSSAPPYLAAPRFIKELSQPSTSKDLGNHS